MLSVGDTFYAKAPKSTDKHLYIIIAIREFTEDALFVNITTDNGNHERCCTLQRGDHPFIRHNSTVNYGDAKTSDVSKIEAAINSGLFTPDKPVSPSLLKKIQEGALRSQAFPPKYLPFIS